MVQTQQYSRKSIIISISALLLAAGLGIIYWYYQRPCAGIVSYQPTRDRQPLLKLFHDNWYWLIPESLDLEFSAEYFFDHQASKREPNVHETIAVYCEAGKPIGFVSYHPESFYKGRLHFIAIDELFRGKGYADKLMTHALQDLKKQGLKVVHLITRTNNEAAQKLYKKLGFKEFWHDDHFVRFEKELT